MADAVHSTSATIIPFPGYVRGQRIDMMPPGSIFGLNGYKKSFCSVRVAEQFGAPRAVDRRCRPRCPAFG